MAGDDNLFELDDSELKFAQSVINARKPGRYTLRQLFGKDHWLQEKLGEVRNYGSRFYQSVLKQRLRYISEDGHKSNSRIYAVHSKD